MMWWLFKIAAIFAAGMWTAFVIAANNDYVAPKFKSWTIIIVTWSYKWVPAIYNWLKSLVQNWRK